MARFEDWPERLQSCVAAAVGAPFQWGTHDCVTWAADVVLALTGADVIADYRGRWDDRAGALECLAEMGGIEAAATARLGAPLETPLYAQRGDVVAISTEEGPALGICLGAELAFVSPAGLTLRSITAAMKAWRVE